MCNVALCFLTVISLRQYMYTINDPLMTNDTDSGYYPGAPLKMILRWDHVCTIVTLTEQYS